MNFDSALIFMCMGFEIKFACRKPSWLNYGFHQEVASAICSELFRPLCLI